jgi:hypothetical protein
MYQLNKNLVIQNEKPLKPFEIKDKIKEIKNFFKTSNNTYFMLLCHEQRDYTLFNFLEKDIAAISTSGNDIQECLENRGIILGIDLTEDKNAYEIWLSINDEAFCYYLFPYDLGVIEIGGSYES